MQSRMNIALKTAIIESRKKQKRIASLARISESRISQIVHGKPASENERKKLARVLGKDAADLFPVAVTESVAPVVESAVAS